MFANKTLVVGSVVTMLLAVGASFGADTTARKYALPGKGSFQMTVPAGWVDKLNQPPQALPPTIVFNAGQDKPFEVLVTPIWRVRADMPVPAKDMIRQSVQKAADDAKAQSVEKVIPVVEFSSSTGPGYYFSATDKAPKPGEYKYLTQGMLKVSELAVTFTILTNDGQEQVMRDAIGMLGSAVHVQP